MTLFIVLDDEEMIWSIVDTISMEEAVRVARNNGQDPYYVVDEKLAHRVSEEEGLKERMIDPRAVEIHKIQRWKVQTRIVDLQDRSTSHTAYCVDTLPMVLQKVIPLLKYDEGYAEFHISLLREKER